MELCYGHPGKLIQVRSGGHQDWNQTTGQADPGSCLPNTLLKRPPSTTGQSCQRRYHCTVACPWRLQGDRGTHLSSHLFVRGSTPQAQGVQLSIYMRGPQRHRQAHPWPSGLRTGGNDRVQGGLSPSCHASNRPPTSTKPRLHTASFTHRVEMKCGSPLHILNHVAQGNEVWFYTFAHQF